MGKDNRGSFVNLPSEDELGRVFSAEARRLIPTGKEDLHFASVDVLLNFLKELGIDTSQFSLHRRWQEALNIGQKLITQAVPVILKQDRGNVDSNTQKVYTYLAEEDQPETSDLILAFGAKTPARAQKAIELYQQGLAPKLLFTGGSPIYSPSKPEAEVYREIALQAGVPESDIVIETKSITMPDNVRSSLNLLDQLNLPYQKIILVNSPYSQRRGYGYMQKYTPEGTVVYRVDAQTREGLRQNDWFTNEEGIKCVLGEYGKIWISLVTNTI